MLYIIHRKYTIEISICDKNIAGWEIKIAIYNQSKYNSVDYSRITLLIRSKNLSENKFAESIGMSGNGFRSMMNNQTLKIEVLEKICEVYSLPITHFFENSNLLKEPDPKYGKQCKECLKKDGKIELLTEQLKQRDDYIKDLYRDLGRKSPGKDGKVA